MKEEEEIDKAMIMRLRESKMATRSFHNAKTQTHPSHMWMFLTVRAVLIPSWVLLSATDSWASTASIAASIWRLRREKDRITSTQPMPISPLTTTTTTRFNPIGRLPQHEFERFTRDAPYQHTDGKKMRQRWE